MNYTSPSLEFASDGSIHIGIDIVSVSLNVKKFDITRGQLLSDGMALRRIYISIRKDGIFYRGSEIRVDDQYLLSEVQKVIGKLTDQIMAEEAA